MFYQCLLGVVTYKKYDETRVLSFPFLAGPSQGTSTWLVKVTMFAKPSTLACVSEVFGPLNKNQPEETV